MIAVASGKRGVILHSNGRGRLKQSEPVISIAKWEELGRYLRGKPTNGSFGRVWDNAIPCFILDSQDICCPEDGGYTDEK